MSTASSVIDARGLVKTFGRTRALDGLDLTVGPGEVHAFLGPNGAGKTTTLRVLLGLLPLDGGTVRLLGGDPWRDTTALHRRLAYVPGDVALWPELSGGEVIDLLTSLRGGAAPARRAELLERFELDPTKKSRAYSKGNRQKVALVAALAADVELYLFDEPTSGLDPLMEEVFQQQVAALRADGRTVLLSSHLLSEAEVLSDHVTIVRHGRAVETGSLADLRHLRRTSVQAEVERPPGDLAALAGVHEVHVEGATVSAEADTEGLAGLVSALSAAGLRSLVSRPATLEELFLRHYQDEDDHEGEGVRA